MTGQSMSAEHQSMVDCGQQQKQLLQKQLQDNQEKDNGTSKDNSNNHQTLNNPDSNGRIKTGNATGKQSKQPSTLNAQIFQLEHYGMYFIVLLVLIPLNLPCKCINLNF